MDKVRDVELVSRRLLVAGTVLLAWMVVASVLGAATGGDLRVNAIQVVIGLAGASLLGAGLVIRYHR